MYTPRSASPAVTLGSLSAAAAGRTFLHRRPAPRGPRRLDRSSLDRGLDFAGRFIGPGDVDRGLDFFFRSRGHLRPVARDTFLNFGGAGTPRTLKGELDFAKLREAHRRCILGKEKKRRVAADLGISEGCLKFHLRGSASMRAALAASPLPAARAA